MFKISKIMCMHELTLLSSLLTCIFPLVSYLEKKNKCITSTIIWNHYIVWPETQLPRDW